MILFDHRIRDLGVEMFYVSFRREPYAGKMLTTFNRGRVEDPWKITVQRS